MAPPFSLDWSSQLQFGGPLMAANQQRTPFNLNFGLGQMQNPMAGVPTMYDMGSWGQQPMQLQAPGQLQMDPSWYTQAPPPPPTSTVQSLGGGLEKTTMPGGGQYLTSAGAPNAAVSMPQAAPMTPDQIRLMEATKAQEALNAPADGAQQGAQGFQFGWNLPTAVVMTQGIGALGNLALGTWGLIQGQNQFDEQMEMMNKNYANSLKSYNTALEDRIRGRSAVGFRSEDQIQSEIDRKKLTGRE
jgi:hypothetical protein